MANLNLVQTNGKDNDKDTEGLAKESPAPCWNVEIDNWEWANTTPFGPENQKQSKSILTDAMSIAEERMSPLKQKTIEQKCFHWEIDHWSQLSHEERGPVCQVGGFQWNLLLFPKGNYGDYSHVALYLELTNASEASFDQHACAQYCLVVSSMSDPTNYYCSDTAGRFSKHIKDWGFNDFISHHHLHSFNDMDGRILPPILENDRIRFSAIVNVVDDPTGVLWISDFENYDSKKETGFVGLKNQGATCYMNSLFQSLYCTNAFRKAVYQIPTENDNPTESIALAMQRLFHKLQFTNDAVDTVEVTKSFKWNPLDTLMQHDVQEFNRLLQDKLEEKMIGTPADGAIRRLFVGRMKSYIRCINVDYESTHSEDYYDIQLNVKGCKDLNESFKNYVAEETMDGDNKYMAGDHGLQDAKKGVTFECFPPVLHLQLKRFEYDMRRDTMVKINDRHEFPLRIDLEPYLCSTADRSSPHIYALHGVLVHSGNVSGGHYFAFIRPTKDGTWLKFDDERVTRATLDDVLDRNYGSPASFGQFHFQNFRRSSNAYMLVYIRECMLDDILDTVDVSDIPQHLWRRLDEENRLWQEAQRKQESRQNSLKVNVFPSSSFLLNKQLGIISDYQPDPMVMSMSVRKDQLYHDFKDYVARSFCINSSDDVRLWSFITRCNKTFRPEKCIDNVIDKNTKVEDLMHYMSGDILCLYAEYTQEFEPAPSATVYPWLYTMADDDDDHEILPSQVDTINTTNTPEKDEPMLVFIKIFIPESQELKGLATMYVYRHQKIESALDRIRYFARFLSHTPLVLYEEETPCFVRTLQLDTTFEESNIKTGDIICVQKQLSEEEMEHLQQQKMYPTAREYMAYLAYQVQVILQPQQHVKEEGLPTIRLNLLRPMSYQEIVAALAYHANIDSNYVLLYRPGHGKRETKWVIVRRYEGCTLHDLLKFADPQQPCLRYQVLEMTVDEYELLRQITIIVCKENRASRNVYTVQVTIARDACFRELLDKIRSETGHDLERYTSKVRFFLGSHHRFEEEYKMDDPIADVPEGGMCQLYAEPIPVDEFSLGSDDVLISVFHYDLYIHMTHSIPFRLLVKQGEPFSDTKKRLQVRTGMTNEEWSKVRCYFIQGDHIREELQDNDKLSGRYITETTAIGLDHPEKTFKPIYERPLRIQG